MGQPVIHFEILTKDPDALATFYRQAFEWDADSAAAVPGAAGMPKYIIARPTGEEFPKQSINGGIGGLPPNGYEGHVTFYIAVDDVEAALQKVEALGGKRMMGPDKVPNGPEIGLFEDPQGHIVGVVRPDM